MKFGRLLRDAIPELPELESLFKCYKSLKKQIKKYPRAGAVESVGSASPDGSDENILSGDDDFPPTGSSPSSSGKPAEVKGKLEERAEHAAQRVRATSSPFSTQQLLELLSES
jgi:hypothetical protein